MDGDDPAAGRWWYAGESPGGPGDDGGSFVDHHMLGGTIWQPQLSSCLLPSQLAIPELPPSEDVMAAWIYPIVCGQDRAAADDGLKVPMTPGSCSKGKLQATDVMFCRAAKDTNSREKEKASGGSSSMKGSATHNITEKRRRCRIAGKLRTLQQLVPGCDHKSSQASTLDQTIQHMKSLQQQVQKMSTSWQAPPEWTTAAVYPVMQTPPVVAVAMPMPPAATFGFRPGVVPMVPSGAMLPYPQNHALLMMSTAAPAAPVCPPAPAGASATAPDAQWSVSGDQQHQHQHKD